MVTNHTLQDVIDRLQKGGVVVLPTETVYGLAANALSEDAVRSIFSIKERPLNDPLIVHVLDATWIDRYAVCDEYYDRVKKVTSHFWPGPLTIILPKRDVIPGIVSAGHSTIALRCPEHPIFREILQSLQLPLAAPSANPFGYISPTTADQVRSTLGDKVDLIVDGGNCRVGLESTIVDITSHIPKILRPGAVTAAEIARAINEPVMDYEQHVVALDPSCPGQLKQHYCTNTKLILFTHATLPQPNNNAHCAYIFNQKPINIEELANTLSTTIGSIFWLSEDGNHKAIAHNLFKTLQTLDNANYDIIYCERTLRNDIGTAIDDRLLRAAAKFNNQ